jgi:DNA-binding PadR family transcriptional regulator
MSYRHLILGLLSERPMTGYDIKKRLCDTMSMIASPSYGAVYPTPHRLLEEGAATMAAQIKRYCWRATWDRTN